MSSNVFTCSGVGVGGGGSLFGILKLDHGAIHIDDDFGLFKIYFYNGSIDIYNYATLHIPNLFREFSSFLICARVAI